MERVSVGTFPEFISQIERLGTKRIFRGVSSKDYPLVPKVGREAIYGRYSQHNERLYFDDFKRKAQPFLARLPQTEGEWLSLGQHHGLPTRLLDWTTSPLMAAFFAVWEKGENDAAIYALSIPDFLDPETFATMPFSVPDVHKVYPAHVSARIAAQNAVFTLHANPPVPLHHPSLVQMTIPRAFCEEFKFKLHDYGILRFNLFPGLDGLCDHLAWRYELLGTGRLEAAFRS